MANAKEIIQIIENTPIDQSILIEGIHGIGKSEVIKDHFENLGYRVEVLFLGQMSDAGDLLGLPERKKIKVDKKEMTITDFCPPAWFPNSENEKVILFLDEINRAKPEVLQVIMELVLNRKLYNRVLPKNCRILSAQNPIDDGLYQVDELDPALLDRFNKYVFKPTVDEWINWGVRNKVSNHILGFISRHNDHLDPPHSKEYKIGTVSPSRRSWKKVSDIISSTDLLENDVDILKTMMLGIVGERSVSAFSKYLREKKNGVHVGTMITNFNDKIKSSLLAMSVQDFVNLNREIIHWFNNNEKLFTENNKSIIADYSYNLQKYLEIIHVEAMAEFYGLLSDENIKGKSWVKLLLIHNHQLASKMMDILSGDSGESKELEENLA